MPSETASKRYADHKRPVVFPGKLIQVIKSRQHIIFLEGNRSLPDKIKIPQILFGRL